jgi:hypothetical protein
MKIWQCIGIMVALTKGLQPDQVYIPCSDTACSTSSSSSSSSVS